MSSLRNLHQESGAARSWIFDNMRAATLTAGLASICLTIMGCASKPETIVITNDPPLYQKSTTAYSMSPLDEAHLKMRDGSRKVLQVALDGTVDINGTARQVKGMQVAEFYSLVKRNNPGATEIKIEEFRPNRVTVLGEVFHQIHTDLGDGPMRIMDAIASANGFTPLANKRRVRLLRQNAGEVEVWELDLRQMMRGDDLDQNLLLKPGDVITVPRNFL